MAAVLVLFTVLLLMKAVGLIALSLVDRPPTPLLPSGPAPLLPPGLDREQALLDALRCGRTTREDYRAAMAALAAEEARAHPWQTPATPDS